jgi:hypothetical protein
LCTKKFFSDKGYFFTTTLDWEKEQHSSGNTAEDGSKVEDIRKAKVFETCWILDFAGTN